MTISLPSLPKPDLASRVRCSQRISVPGQRVSFEKLGTRWVATGWENGIPVARRPVSEERLIHTLSPFPVNRILFMKKGFNE